MNTTEPTCAATDEGRPCARTAVMHTPVPLCEPHRIEIALTVVPDLLRGHLVAATAEAAAPAPRMALADAAQTADHHRLLSDGTHEPIVYFIVNGGRVKIGYTTNLRSRLSALTLRADNVLLALAGGPELERALHARFAAHRQGTSEWFDMAPVMFRYVASRQPGAASTVRTRPGGALPDDPAVVYTNPVERAIRPLYDTLGARPATGRMLKAMTAAGLDPKESTARDARRRIERREPALKQLAGADPSAIPEIP